MIRHCFPGILIALLLSNAAFTQRTSFSDTVQQIDQLFAAWNTATPGAAVSVSRSGKIIYRKAFGMADLEHNVINTPETVFEAGSVSKQFTAAAVLLLVQEGKINLQDDIRKYFPDFPDYGVTITVEHLLHHTSGLKDWGSVISLSGWPRGTRIYTPAHVKEIIWRQKGLNFLPGSAYGYSNSNYNFLGFLVEKVSGRNLRDFTHEKLFVPAGMDNTRWRDNFRTIVPNRAIAYSRFGNLYRQNMPFENTFGHGALLTTIGDLEKWNRRWTLQTLGEEINRLQKTKVKLTNGKEITYAAGVTVTSVNGFEEINHSGATAGYRAWLAYYPEKELSVVYLSNDGSIDPGTMGRQVAELFLGKNNPPLPPAPETTLKIDKEQLQKYTGLYIRHINDDVLELYLSSDSLRVKGMGGGLIPFAPQQFYFRGFILSFPAVGENAGQVLFQSPSGDTATYLRVKTFRPAEKELQEFAGAYYSEEADAKVILQVKDGRLWLLRHGDERTALTPSFTDAFFDTDESLFQFIRDKRKKVTGFTVSIPRARNVLFTRL